MKLKTDSITKTVWAFIIGFSLILLILFSFSSCRTLKQVQRSKTDSSFVDKSKYDSLVHEKLISDSIINDMLQEAGNMDIVFDAGKPIPDTVKIKADCLPITTVTSNADGSFSLVTSQRLKALNFNYSVLQQRYDSLHRENDQDKRVIADLNQQLSVKTKEVIKTVDRPFIPEWVYLVIILAALFTVYSLYKRFS